MISRVAAWNEFTGCCWATDNVRSHEERGREQRPGQDCSCSAGQASFSGVLVQQGSVLHRHLLVIPYAPKGP